MVDSDDNLVGILSEKDCIHAQMRAIYRVVHPADHHESGFLYLSAVSAPDKIPR